jgi:predicted CXXCH cytochrome family protein
MRKAKQGVSLLQGSLIALATLTLLALGSGSALAAVLTSADCAKCHTSESLAVLEKGMAHKTSVSCQDCHGGHRPMKAENIPNCAMCHAGAPHYEVGNCLSCHDPHMPLEIVLEGELKDVCVSCHGSVGKDLVAAPSMHGQVSCNFCHADRHGFIPNCAQCHTPHSPEMKQNDCLICHDAHTPTVLAFRGKAPSNLCASCHGEINQQIAANKSQHRDLACVECHAQKHEAVPQCSDCHGMPHAKGMHERFPRCGDCHGIAHNLSDGNR